MIPLPNLGLGFTGGTTRGGDVQNQFGDTRTGGINFGTQFMGGDLPMYLIMGAALVATYFIARKAFK